MNSPAVYHFQEPRDFLAHVFKEKQARNPRFSLRSWSRQLGFSSPNVLSMILRGERRMQLELVGRVSESLKLSSDEQRYLQILTLFANADSTAEKEIYADLLRQLRPERKFSSLALDRFRLVADWYHFAIYEMVALKDFKADPEWIARRLGGVISPITAREALERLVRLGLVKRSKTNRYERGSADQLSTSDDVPSEALRKFHAQMIEKALQALREQPVEERQISGNTFAIARGRLRVAKEMIRKFELELADACVSEADADEVYQLNVQLFRLTEGVKK